MSDTSDTGESTSGSPAPRRSPAFLATVVAIPVAVLICFIVFLVLAQHRQDDARAAAQAGHVKSISAPSGTDAACGALLGALPADLGGFHRDASGGPSGFAHWTSDTAGAVEIRCGTDRPAALNSTSKLQIVNGVQWLQATPAGAPEPDGGSYWTAVDHRPYVTLWLPDGAGTTAVQAVSDEIRAHLKAASLDLGK